MSEEKKLTANDLVDLIKQCHPSRVGWAVLTNVCDNTSGYTRTCDAVALSTWQSEGLKRLHGFEVKVSRSDWIREIQDVDKAETFSKFCDYWWIVATPGIVRLEELPATWGLYEPVGQTLKVRRPATHTKPDPVSRHFLCALLRRMTQQAPDLVELEKAKTEGIAIGRKAAEQEYQHRSGAPEYVVKGYEELLGRVKKFEELSGVRLDAWNLGNVGSAVAKIVRGKEELERSDRAVEIYYSTLSRHLKNLKEFAKELKGVAESF